VGIYRRWGCHLNLTLLITQFECEIAGLVALTYRSCFPSVQIKIYNVEMRPKGFLLDELLGGRVAVISGSHHHEGSDLKLKDLGFKHLPVLFSSMGLPELSIGHFSGF